MSSLPAAPPPGDATPPAPGGSSGESREGEAAAESAAESAEVPLHDFSVQKEVHRQIRNDPDYDDWEYGTEPLPQESWSPAAGESP